MRCFFLRLNKQKSGEKGKGSGQRAQQDKEEDVPKSPELTPLARPVCSHLTLPTLSVRTRRQLSFGCCFCSFDRKAPWKLNCVECDVASPHLGKKKIQAWIVDCFLGEKKSSKWLAGGYVGDVPCGWQAWKGPTNFLSTAVQMCFIWFPRQGTDWGCGWRQSLLSGCRLVEQPATPAGSICLRPLGHLQHRKELSWARCAVADVAVRGSGVWGGVVAGGR